MALAQTTTIDFPGPEGYAPYRFALETYNKMIKDGIIKEHWLNKAIAEEATTKDGRKYFITTYETKVEFLIPMPNFESFSESPYVMRFTTQLTGYTQLRDDEHERMFLTPFIIEHLAHAYMTKFINERDDRT